MEERPVAKAPTTSIDADQIDAEETARVADAYFAALARRDLDAAVALWRPGGRENVRGQVDAVAPDAVREFLGGIFAAFPDFLFEVVETTVQDDRAAMRWRATGTFAGAPFNGVEATGARIELEGVDVLIVRGGELVENNAFPDVMGFVRQLGLMPPAESPLEQRMFRVFNARTRVGRRLVSGPEPIADGVWVMRGGFPTKTMNVYLVRDGDGVLLFDAGIKAMTNAVAAAGASLGGITRVILGHAHADHRGVASGLGAPVFCHPADRADAEGDGGAHYMDLSKLNVAGRLVFPHLLKMWDGGPVKITGTVEEGDEIAGFRVVHLPGHAPGLIGLWRESDRLVLASDCFYTLDPQTGRKGHPRVPHAAFNADTEQARASIRKLAAMEPATAWAGHADPLTGDVRAQLEQAAATT
jgi:glyoxylase-like metal-dependent hydrolase (beta-lactamase superfamily II)/predicted ester cyclase